MKIKQTTKTRYYKNNGYLLVTTVPMHKTAHSQYTVEDKDTIYFKFDKSIDFKSHKHAHPNKRLCKVFTINYKT